MHMIINLCIGKELRVLNFYPHSTTNYYKDLKKILGVKSSIIHGKVRCEHRSCMGIQLAISLSTYHAWKNTK